MINRKILSLLFSIFIVVTLHAQEKIIDIPISGRFQSTSLENFFQQVKNEYGLTFYYQQEWIDSMVVNQSFDQVSIKNALEKILGGTKLTFQFFQEDIIVVPKSTIKEYSVDMEQVDLLIIGDPVNEGRYKQATIRGTVFDGKNRERLPGAVIFNKTINEGISANKNGDFVWELPAGEHELQLSFMGFEPRNQKVKLIENGTVTFDLFEESHNLAEVTVLGEDQNGSRSQMSMVKVQAKLIKELPVLMGEADVIKSVVMMPGINSVGELASGFNVRGGNTDQNLVLIDGAPIFNTSHLFGFFSMINPDAVEDIVIYKGGMPASYGERVSSVMDVKLKDGNTETLKVYGGLGIINSRVTVEGPFKKQKKSSFLFGGRSTYSDWVLRQMKNVEFQNSTARFFDVNGNINLNLGDKNELKLMGYVSGDEFNLNSNSLYSYDNTIASLNWNDAFGERVRSDLALSYSNYNFKLTETSDFGADLDYDLSTGIENIGFKYALSYLPNNSLKFETGFQGTGYRVNPGKITPVTAGSEIVSEKINDEQAVEMAGFISSDFDLSERLAMSVGLRYSHFLNLGESTVYFYEEDKTKTQESVTDVKEFDKNEVVKRYDGLEPRVSFKYDLTSESSLRWSYQRVYQYLNQISNTSVVSPADFWKVSDTHLKPLIADQLAFGYFNNSFEKNIEASVEIYYKKLKNILEYKNGVSLVMNHNIERDLIQASGYSYGLELLLKKAKGRLNGWISYAYSRTMRKTDKLLDEETINRGEYYPSVYDKPHDLSVIANYQVSRRWRLSANFVFASGRPTTLPELRYNYGGEQIVYYSDRNEYRMPPYHRLDFSITFDENLRNKRMWKGSWTLSVYNLYGRNNPYSVYYLKSSPQNLDAGLYGLFKFSIIGVPVPSLTYNFRF